jgi:hypothetical protein
MKHNELRKFQRSLDEAGAPSKQTKLLEYLVPTLEQDIVRLTETKNARKLVFSHKLEIWWGRSIEKDIRPFAIPEAVRTGHVYLWAAVACLLFESLVAAMIFSGMDMSPWLGAVFAVVTGIILHGIVSLALNSLERPLETLRKVRHWVLAPSAIFFGISFVLLLLARTVTGEVAVQLLPAFNTSLWTITIGLVGMAGAFLAAREVLVWSQRDEREFNGLELEESRTKAFRDTALSHFLTVTTGMSGSTRVEFSEESTTRTASNETSSFPSTGRPTGFGTFSAVAALLLLLPLVNTSCSRGSSQTLEGTSRAADTLTRPESVVVPAESELELDVDTSSSPDDDALKEFLQQLRVKLPDIIERYNIVKVSVYAFNQDGWKARAAFSQDIPRLSVQQSPQTNAGEIGVLPNISSAVDTHNESAKRQQSEEARRLRRVRIAELLEDLKVSALLPDSAGEEPPCTDLNGLLHRTSRSNSPRKRFVIIVTDGHETCGTLTPPSRPPGSNVALVIVLIPEKPTQSDLDISYKQFNVRETELIEVAPWAVVVPYFQLVDGYEQVFEKATYSK